uniref:Uncharacterized protein n=1 Tax=Timema shepardi TaxID=629360 RepID=A0A7R9FXN4_TIMSH|nr:unnamed protein product [Timema shepardi]
MEIIVLMIKGVYHNVVQLARESFLSGKTKPLSFREKQLKQFLKMYEENEDEMVLALATDLRKSPEQREPQRGWASPYTPLAEVHYQRFCSAYYPQYHQPMDLQIT